MKNNPTIDLLKLLDRPIAFHPSFVGLTGSVNAALMLSQSVYWSNRTSDPQGWFFKTAEEWEEETCLSRREQEIARRKLKATGFWQEELRGIPARMYYRIDQDVLRQSLSDGGAQSLTVDQVIDAFGPELANLSQGGMLRASKLNKSKAKPGKVEHVDYAEILRRHGMVCHICGNPITRGVGSKPEFLHFDHVHPLHHGGDHTYDNIRPSHAKCSLAKSASTLDKLDSPTTGKPVPPCTDTPVSLYTDKLDALCTDKLYKEAETTTETTTERERKGKLSPLPVIEDFDGHNEEMDSVISFLKESYHLTGYIKPYQERDLAQLSFQIIQNKIALSDLKQFFTTARKIPPMNFLVSDYFLAQENASRAAKASPATQNTNIVARLKEQMPDDIKQASEATQVKWIANHYAEAKQQMAATTA